MGDLSQRTMRYLGTALGAFSVVLAITTLICRDWIEALTGVNLDHRNGWIESLIGGAIAIASVQTALMARRWWQQMVATRKITESDLSKSGASAPLT